MKLIINLLILFFVLNVSAQKNMDTIYGNPKSVSVKVVFLKREVPKMYTEYHGDIFRNISRFRIMNIKNLYRRNKVSYINYQMFFSEKNLKEKEIWYNFPNEIERTIYYSYDKNENLIEEKEVYFDDVFYLKRNYYNKSNKIIASSWNNTDNPNEFTHKYYLRNKADILTRLEGTNEEGRISSYNYQLNENGKVIREYWVEDINWRFPFNKSENTNKELTKVEYKYDNNGNKIQQINYNTSTKKIYSRQKYKYDTLNNLIEIKSYLNNQDTTKYKKTKYAFSENNLLKGEAYLDLDGSILQSTEYFYNKENYITKTIHFQDNINSTFTFKYKFDRKGNWTKITKIVNGEPLYVWTRKIKYY